PARCRPGGSAGSGTLHSRRPPQRDVREKGTTRAGSRPRQQCRPGPQGAEEEDAARGHFPRDEAPRPLRKTLGKEGAREGGSDPPGAQARAQAHAARGAAAHEAAAHARRRRTRRPGPPAAPPELLSESFITNDASAGPPARAVVFCGRAIPSCGQPARQMPTASRGRGKSSRGTARLMPSSGGSLTRPPALREFLAAKEAGRPFDAAAYAKCLKDSVAEVVRRQAAIGLDVISDGEFGKAISWAQYALFRLGGCERRPVKGGGKSFTRRRGP